MFLSEEMWTGILAYFADIFSRLTNVKSFLQCYCIKIFTLHNKPVLSKNQVFCNVHVQKDDIGVFLYLQGFVGSTSINKKELLSAMSQHLKD